MILKIPRRIGDEYVICLAEEPLLPDVTKRARVRAGSYAYDLVTSIYDYVLKRSLDLKRDYEEFFSVEYPTFAEYLHRRLRLTQDLIDQLVPQYDRSARIMLFEWMPSFFVESLEANVLDTLFGARGADET